MKISSKYLATVGAALAATVTLSASHALATTALTAYSSGDIFIGFRQTGVTNTLVADLGSVTKFLPTSLGGTWDGATSFKVTFGVIPGTLTVVDNLSADLVANFGLDWSDNLTDGTGVRWGVVGITDNAVDNTPINGYNARTAFVTKARTNPDVQSSALASISNNNFGASFNSFANGIGGGSYSNQNSTANSSVAYIGDGSQANNWNTQIGSTGTFNLGAGRVVEQLSSGTYQGTTNSVLDFYVAPFSGSSLTSSRTFTGGSFTLNSAGELTYGIVPEPSSIALLSLGAMFIGATRSRKRSELSNSKKH